MIENVIGILDIKSFLISRGFTKIHGLGIYEIKRFMDSPSRKGILFFTPIPGNPEANYSIKFDDKVIFLISKNIWFPRQIQKKFVYSLIQFYTILINVGCNIQITELDLEIFTGEKKNNNEYNLNCMITAISKYNWKLIKSIGDYDDGKHSLYAIQKEFKFKVFGWKGKCEVIVNDYDNLENGIFFKNIIIFSPSFPSKIEYHQDKVNKDNYMKVHPHVKREIPCFGEFIPILHSLENNFSNSREIYCTIIEKLEDTINKFLSSYNPGSPFYKINFLSRPKKGELYKRVVVKRKMNGASISR